MSTRPFEIVSEADPNFEQKASPPLKSAVEIARRSAGVVPKPVNWERTATPEQRRARLEQSRKLEAKLDKEGKKILGLRKVKATYKIELHFGHKRRLSGDNQIRIHVWESGKRLHGGGDDLMYRCIRVEGEGAPGCGKFISSDFVVNGVAHCPHCKGSFKAEHLGRVYENVLSMRKIAEVLTDIFNVLNRDADIYLKFHKTDIRYLAAAGRLGDREARRRKGLAIYPLANIIKDLSSGEDLTKRLHAFVTN
jgi:hypothetical protein